MRTSIVLTYNDRFDREVRWHVQHGIRTCQFGIGTDALVDETDDS